VSDKKGTDSKIKTGTTPKISTTKVKEEKKSVDNKLPPIKENKETKEVKSKDKDK
jgi:hypothetical protein